MSSVATSNGPIIAGPSDRRGPRPAVPVVAFMLTTLLGGCATVGATLGSGVGEKLLDRAPYYTGSLPGTPAQSRIAHLPIAFQRGATQEAFFDPKDHAGTPVAALLAEMNAYLDRLGVTRRIAVDASRRAVPPDVQFGCEPAPLIECDAEADGPSLGHPWMRLAVGRPSVEWVQSVATALDAADRDLVLVVTLEVGQYWTHQRDLVGRKEVRLGTGHTAGVPWLTALDRPAQVLQLTGAIVDASGRAVRIGAEGLVARRTNIVLGGLGAKELIGDTDVERLRTARRDDLPGAPLVWQIALGHLLEQLIGLPVGQLRG
jgi:hypothetical protein